MDCCGGTEESKGGGGEDEEGADAAAALPCAVEPAGAPVAAVAEFYGDWRGD
jgi:hypothetical protein